MTAEVSRIEIVRKGIRSGSGADQWLVRDTRTQNYYIVSGISAPFTGWEVLVFPATEAGEITDWMDVAGGRGMTHEEAIANLESGL